MDLKGYFFKKKFSTGQVVGLLTTAFLGVTVFAYATVTIPNIFTADTTAKASEVNANFQAVADAINNRTSATLAGMAGTWNYTKNGSHLNIGDTICTTSGTGTLTLYSNGTLSDVQDDTYNYCQGTGVVTNTGATYTGTWTVSANGAGTLTYTPGPTVPFRVSKGLNLMMSNWHTNSSTGTMTYLRQ